MCESRGRVYIVGNRNRTLTLAMSRTSKVLGQIRLWFEQFGQTCGTKLLIEFFEA